MSDNERIFWTLAAIIGFYCYRSIVRRIDQRFDTLDKKINTLLESSGGEYPKEKHISMKAKLAIQQGDRNKAIALILNETACSKSQALALIEKLEKIKF